MLTTTSAFCIFVPSTSFSPALGDFKVPHDTSNENENSSAPENMTVKERFAELAGILAAGALRTRQSVRSTNGTVDEPGHARDLGPVHMPEK